MSTHYDPHDVSVGVNAATGCVSIDVGEDSAPQVSRSDDGELSIFVPKGPVTGNVNFDDAAQAAGIANKGAAGTDDLTFAVLNDAGVVKTVTVTGAKTGGVRHNYAGASAGSASVPFAGKVLSAPA